MGQVSIPVDLHNPGQVFACLGLLEAADFLCGMAEGKFEWSDEPRFTLRAENSGNPLEVILEFLAQTDVAAVAPADRGEIPGAKLLETFPDKEPDAMALPILLTGKGGESICLTHWCDGSSRGDFKLYSGNRSALTIASAMLRGTASKAGKTKNHGVSQLWLERRHELLSDPFGTVTTMGGSFNFDPRGAWTAIDVGYSPNEHKQGVMASPLVEMLALWGLEHARPATVSNRLHRYAVWGTMLPPQLARAALSCDFSTVKRRVFQFSLELSGKNKVVYYAIEEGTP